MEKSKDPFLTIQINSEQDWEYIEDKDLSSSDGNEDASPLVPSGSQKEPSNRGQGRGHKKKARFTPEELAIVVEELSAHNKLLFTIHQDPAKAQCKAAKWADILNRVNAHQVTFRTIDDIKKRWHDLRKTARKKLFKIRREQGKPGGVSPRKKTRLTRLEKMAAKTMTPKMSYFFSSDDILDSNEDSDVSSHEKLPKSKVPQREPYMTRRKSQMVMTQISDEKNSEASTSCLSSYSEDMFNGKTEMSSESAAPDNHQLAQKATNNPPTAISVESEGDWEYAEEKVVIKEERIIRRSQAHSSWGASAAQPTQAMSRWQAKVHKRKARFNPEELAIVAEELSSYNKLLFRAQHNLADVQRKAHKWAEILRRVNAVSITHRTIGDIKKRWHKLRRTTKKKLLQMRRQMQEKGVEETHLTKFEEMAARTMTPQMIYGVSEGLDIIESEEEARVSLMTNGLQEEPCEINHVVPCEQEESTNEAQNSQRILLKIVPTSSTNNHIISMEDPESPISVIASPDTQLGFIRHSPTPPMRGHEPVEIAMQPDLLAHHVGQLVESIREHNELFRSQRRNELLLESRMVCLENAVKTMVQTNHALIQSQAQHTQELGHLTQAVCQLVEQMATSPPGTFLPSAHQDLAPRTAVSYLPPPYDPSFPL
ncbi:uncharacterized protein LOC108702770 [Xenopus laevis]|uniref:Uncharacterized protein LOC108702770 n=2 Tax=Xenopus laevis TaxID=8355 RepID=A0A1L8EMP3_XENLA|nr:uncharacterized protein LOC108702770 [Xenopus laevis]XP_041434103.1 uncharacterized protein LOC108702770 [Xenopus laevis]XP_041434104.1 uncharacterized protein LOC108702770 [Xenopus laevis]OCT60604.1 hypothetical protein XELAEV_18046629mg [Xenopus laevis]